MKVNANFSAGATKKVNPLEEAINSNFSQQNTPSDARETVLTASKSNSDENTQVSQNKTVSADSKSQISNASRREVKEKFLVSMSKGERSIFKAFCAMQNVSMNHFVMCAMDYFKEDLENGKVSLSAHSYKRRES
ncbi:hypothetical protein [Treponema sp.]|uniref:hypothetical protein n=1 Tax=Treponema sp. TaxID=166 RepID=UPI003890B814